MYSISSFKFLTNCQTDIPIRDLENNKHTAKIKEDISTILTKFSNKHETVPGMKINFVDTILLSLFFTTLADLLFLVFLLRVNYMLFFSCSYCSVPPGERLAKSSCTFKQNLARFRCYSTRHRRRIGTMEQKCRSWFSTILKQYKLFTIE
jgi:hypothetical protein